MIMRKQEQVDTLVRARAAANAVLGRRYSGP